MTDTKGSIDRWLLAAIALIAVALVAGLLIMTGGDDGDGTAAPPAETGEPTRSEPSETDPDDGAATAGEPDDPTSRGDDDGSADTPGDPVDSDDPSSPGATPGTSEGEGASDGGSPPSTGNGVGGGGSTLDYLALDPVGPSVFPSGGSGGSTPSTPRPPTGGPSSEPTTRPVTTTTAAPGPTTTAPATTTTRPVTTTTTPATTTTTTAPATTTTTTAPTTTTTTEATTTTTEPTTTTTTEPGSTTEPPGPDPAGRDTAGWRFVPNALLLEPGETAEVRLVHADPDGRDSGGTAPDEPPLHTVGDGVATYTPLGEGRFEVVAGTTLGSDVTAAEVPHAELNVLLMVTVANASDDAIAIPDEDVAWPDPTADDLAPLVDPTAPHQTPSGVGPFPWVRIRAISSTPATDLDDLDVNEFRLPFALVGTDLAVGDLVYGTGASGILGEVMSVENGEHEGRSYQLIGVELRAPDRFFDELNVRYRSDDLFDVNAFPTLDEIGDEDPEPGPRFARSLPTQADPRKPDESGIQIGPCKIEGSAGVAGVDVVLPKDFGKTGGLVPYFDGDMTVSGGGWFSDKEVMMEIKGGLKGRIEAGISAKLGLSGKAKLTCESPTLVDIDLPAPPPIGAFLTAGASPKLAFEIEAEGHLGPELELKASCFIEPTVQLGFRFDSEATPVFESLNDRSLEGPECSFQHELLDDRSSPGSLAADFQVGLKLGVTSPLNVRIGGAPMARMAKFLNQENFGKLDFFEGGVAIIGGFSWANKTHVRSKAETPALADLGVNIEAGLRIEPIEWIIEKARREVKVTISVPKLDMDIPIIQFLRGINADKSPTVTVDGDSIEDGVNVGDRVDVRARTGTGASRAAVSLDFGIEELEALVKVKGKWEEFADVELDELTQPEGKTDGPTVEAHFEVTRQMCNRIGAKSHEVIILSKSKLWGIPFPGAIATFELRCDVPDLFWDPDDITFPAEEIGDDGTLVKTADLRLFGADPDGAHLHRIEDLPPWMSFTADDEHLLVPGIYEDADGRMREGHQAVFSFTVDCDVLGDERKFDALSAGIVGDQLIQEAVLDIDADCREKYATLSPEMLVEPGGVLTIHHSDGQEGVSWTLSGGGALTEFSETSGTFPAGKGKVQVDVDMWRERPEPICDEQVLPELTLTGELTSRYAELETVDLVFPEVVIPGTDDCDPDDDPPNPPTGGQRTANSVGDPHLRTFDGATYDMHVLGEYRYLVPQDPTADLPVLHVRHELLPPRAVGATVIGAVAIEHRGHRVEAYAQPQRALVIDGVSVPRSQVRADKLTDGMLVTVDRGGNLAVEAGGLVYRIRRWADFDLLHIDVTAPDGTPVWGLLGSPNGNRSDDLRHADGRPVSLEDARARGDEFFDFSESWRVTDIEDSLFTIPTDSFDAEIHPMDTAALQPYVQQVQDMYATLEPICGGLESLDDSSYGVQMMALELAVGMPLRDAAVNTCIYQVRGQISEAGDDFSGGAARQQVTVSAPGLVTCETVTDVYGNYTCTMPVDFDALDAGGVPDGPPTVTLTVEHPDGEMAGQAQGTFERKADFGSDRSGDPDEVTSLLILNEEMESLSTAGLDLTGMVRMYGEPAATRLQLTVAEYTDRGGYVRTAHANITTAEDGTFDARRFLADDTARAVVHVRFLEVGHTERFEVPVTGEAHQPVVLDLAYHPTVLEIGGVWDAPNGRIHVRMQRDGRSTTKWVTPIIDEGRWSAEIPLSMGTELVELIAQVTPHLPDGPSITLTDLEPGLQPVTFDVVHHPIELTVSGVVDLDGEIPTTPLSLQIESFDENGSRTQSIRRTVTVDPADGTYEIDVGTLRQDTVEVAGTLRAGVDSALWGTGRIPVAVGRNELTVSIGQGALTHFELDGTIRVGGAVPNDPVPVQIEVLDGDGLRIQLIDETVEPDRIDASFALPRMVLREGASEVNVTVKPTPEQGSWYISRMAVTAGVNRMTVEVDTSSSMSVTGTVSIGGGPATGTVPLVLEVFDSPHGRIDRIERDAELDPDGGFDLGSMVISEDAVRVDVTVTATPEGATWVESFPVTVGSNPIHVDAVMRRIVIEGLLTDWGEVPLNQSLIVVTWLRDGEWAGGDSFWTYPALDGGFELELVPGNDRNGFRISTGYGSDQVSFTHDLTAEAEQTFAFDGRRAQIHLTGRLTMEGDPVAPGILDGRLRKIDGTETVDVNRRFDVMVGADGAYEVDISLPEVDPDVDWQLVIEGAGLDREIPLGRPAQGVSSLTVDNDAAELLELTARVLVDPNEGKILADAFDWDPNRQTWTTESGIHVKVDTDLGDTREVTVLVPTSTTWVRLGAVGETLTRAVPVPSGGAGGDLGEIDLRHRTAQVEVSGTSVSNRDFCPAPETIVFEAKLIALHDDGEGWFNETLIDSFVVFPDADTSEYLAELTLDPIPDADRHIIRFEGAPGYSQWAVFLRRDVDLDPDDLAAGRVELEVDLLSQCAM